MTVTNKIIICLNGLDCRLHVQAENVNFAWQLLENLFLFVKKRSVEKNIQIYELWSVGIFLRNNWTDKFLIHLKFWIDIFPPNKFNKKVFNVMHAMKWMAARYFSSIFQFYMSSPSFSIKICAIILSLSMLICSSRSTNSNKPVHSIQMRHEYMPQQMQNYRAKRNIWRRKNGSVISSCHESRLWNITN